MKKNHIIFLVIFLLCIGAAIIFAFTTSARPDPEKGITSWIAAVNSHDFDRVYDLSPQSVQRQVNRSAFLAVQSGNPFLAPGIIIKSYTVLNKTISGDKSNITTQLELQMPAKVNQSEQDISFYIKFVEDYENGEWHVWTTSPF